MPAPPPITRVATLSSLLTGTKGPKGIKWDPRGDPRAPSAPFGGMGPGGPLGLFRSHSEWKAISSGGSLRKETHKVIEKFDDFWVPLLNIRNLLRPLCRFYKVPIPGGPREGQGGPRGTQKEPRGIPKDPRGPEGNQGTQRTQRTQSDPR